MPLRTLDYEEETRRPRGPRPGLNLPPEQRGRRKPRDPDEEEALRRLDRAQWDLYLKSGKLEILGPRHYRYHLGQEKIVEYLRKLST